MESFKTKCVTLTFTGEPLMRPSSLITRSHSRCPTMSNTPPTSLCRFVTSSPAWRSITRTVALWVCRDDKGIHASGWTVGRTSVCHQCPLLTNEALRAEGQVRCNGPEGGRTKYFAELCNASRRQAGDPRRTCRHPIPLPFSAVANSRRCVEFRREGFSDYDRCDGHFLSEAKSGRSTVLTGSSSFLVILKMSSDRPASCPETSSQCL